MALMLTANELDNHSGGYRNGKVANLQVAEAKDGMLELRAIVSRHAAQSVGSTLCRARETDRLSALAGATSGYAVRAQRAKNAN
jgi:hypothetical protein